MTQYMISVIHAEEGPDFAEDVDIQEIYGKVEAFNQELRDNGSWVFAGGLEEDMSQAFSADGTSGTMVVSDGPYTETTEYLGGITIIDVPDVEQAREWAAKIAEGCGWPQEVRVVK